MTGLYLRSAPGRCCPDHECGYVSWDGKTCKYCDSECKDCIHNKHSDAMAELGEEQLGYLEKVNKESLGEVAFRRKYVCEYIGD